MEIRERVQLRECCVVPYRANGSGIEFCLVTPISENRWEFPKVALDPEAPIAELLMQAAEAAGLQGEIEADEAIGDYVSSRGNESRSMIGYLMRVDRVNDAWIHQGNQKRLWCLAEEGRVRIRRKPLRRFIDLALRAVEGPRQPIADGNGHAHANGNGHRNGNGHPR